MHSHAALFTGPVEQAVSSVVEELRAGMGGREIDLLVVFFSNDYVDQVDSLASELHDQLKPRVMLGSQAECVVGGDREIEQDAAISVWAAHLPDAPLHPMELTFERTPDGGVIAGWPEALADQWPADSSMIVLGEPFSFPADLLAERVADEHPDCVVAGGMASGAQTPNELHLILNGEVVREGAVAVLMAPPVRLRCVVSQGCRPIGSPMIVTKAERNLILELGGHSALQQLDTVFRSLPNHEQAMAQRGLHIGRVINEYQETFEAGDFLIRNVMGIDPESGAVATSDFFRVGQTVQFHLRDQDSADRELDQLLTTAAQRSSAAGGLLFSCNGRGTRMFDEPHHDAAAIQKHFPQLPVAGLFAQGEVGPVGGRSFVHGFTACLALLEPSEIDEDEPIKRDS